MAKGTPKRDGRGYFLPGSVPINKIHISKEKLEELYSLYGCKKIAEILSISKTTVLKYIHEYNIPIKNYKKFPEYWKKALRKKKSKPSHLKDKNKYNCASIMKTSLALRKENSPLWKPEIHSHEKVKCLCGCGEYINKYDKRGRVRIYKKNHNKKGLFTTERVSGKNSNNWKGGVTTEHNKIRKSKIYNEWRKGVYKRDNWTCQKCKTKTKDIVAHHIKAFSDFPDLRFELWNGITLCRSCHLKVHLYQKRRQTNEKKEWHTLKKF